jgi:guanine deaminase
LQAYRAAIFHLLEDPAVAGPEAHAYHPDGLLLVDGGHILACGDYRDLAPRLGDTPVETLPGRLITPGFIEPAHLPGRGGVRRPRPRRRRRRGVRR